MLSEFIERNTPHLFAAGAVQRLGEEMTESLHQIREEARSQVCSQGGTVARRLTAKRISFGRIKVTRIGTNPCRVSFDTSNVQGVDDDLVIKPYEWKGSVAFLRDCNRGESHNELGMQAVELVGDEVDGDGDLVKNEMTIGDQTALAVYLAAQPRPTTKVELAALGLIESPNAEELASIARGFTFFNRVGCGSCHRPLLPIDDPIFSEPSRNPSYRDASFPGGQNPIGRKVDPEFPVTLISPWISPTT